MYNFVPSAGLTLAGNLERITKNGKYLYPVLLLSPTIRSILRKLKLRRHAGQGLEGSFAASVQRWVVRAANVPESEREL